MADRLVFLHGFTQTHHHWHACAHRIAAQLAEPPTLALVDLPGHGLGSADRRSIDAVAPDLPGAGGRGTWIAYSMGGRFALAAAVTAPPQIEALVLVGATAGLELADDRAARVDEDERRARRIETAGVDRFVDEWLAAPMFAGVPFSERDRRYRRRNTATGLASSLRLAGTGAQQPVWDRLDRIRVPVLVLAGEQDVKFTAIGRRLADAITGATFAPIPGAGHAAHTERPDETATVIADWIAARVR